MSDPETRRPWPIALMAALSITLATALVGGWLHLRMAAQQAAETGPGFNATQAMELAGAQVPAETESFYFFILERAAPDESVDLAAKLWLAANEHDFVGIAGADAQHNRRVLLAALAATRGRELAGLVIIYVGPADQQEELNAVVRAAGAELRFVPYTHAAPAIQETI